MNNFVCLGKTVAWDRNVRFDTVPTWFLPSLFANQERFVQSAASPPCSFTVMFSYSGNYVPRNSAYRHRLLPAFFRSKGEETWNQTRRISLPLQSIGLIVSFNRENENFVSNLDQEPVDHFNSRLANDKHTQEHSGMLSFLPKEIIRNREGGWCVADRDRPVRSQLFSLCNYTETVR